MTSRLDAARQALAAAEAATRSGGRSRSSPLSAEDAALDSASSSPSSAPHGTTRALSRRAPTGEEGTSSAPTGVPRPPSTSVANAADADADPHAIARHIVLRQLALAPRSRAQLAQALHSRGCDSSVAAAVLDRMEHVGLIDDVAFAQQFVRSRHELKGLARGALRRELESRGIDPQLAREAAAQVSDAQEQARARELARKRLATLHGLAPQTQTRRLAAALARRGYSAGVVFGAVQDVMAEAPEHARD